jgi:hypothetical protein
MNRSFLAMFATLVTFILSFFLTLSGCFGMKCNCPEVDDLAFPVEGDFSFTQIWEYPNDTSESVEWMDSSWSDISEGSIVVSDEDISAIYSLETGETIEVIFEVTSSQYDLDD